MKRKSLFATFLMLSAVLTLTSCQNEGWNFPDYEYQSVYFAYQYPVRTIVLGESKFDNELDNNHQFKVMATTAGVYENENHVMVDFEVDASMINGFQFSSSGNPIQALPDNYYNFTGDSDQLTIPKGELAGGITVQLTDAFFDDPNAFNTTYVLPIKMVDVANADTILSGDPKDAVSNPRRGVSGDWDVVPKDYTFYAVKYINRLDGFYLRRGEDLFTGPNGNTETRVRRAEHVVKDEVVELNTQTLTQVEFPIAIQDNQGNDINVTILLDFDDQGNITVSDNATDYSATGSGTFINKSESTESWGDKSRNAIYLDYEIDWDSSQRFVETADTLVLRDRGVGMETFTPALQ
ncbi:DUF5627 domain-containing protein [Aliifodinibius sp. S!AR15-10]|uniref:DUF5627 domain-containing protein n=1 Tax=Aliifodinibius sp. S!AR15-10 TaxID=2950437 RepID=UPI00285D042E|nr:DUF5627 domain-containing protein [Aliifodinibius sp. S!AR15-10]MDR8393359.1 DUF5627 domain-containing protein [Aliifodinibius sp. S!AR15-10]